MEVQTPKKKNLFQLISENKKIILIIQISIFIITIMLAMLGRIYSWDSGVIELLDNIYTACIITIIISIFNWNVQDEYERTLDAVKDESERKVKATIDSLTESHNAFLSSIEKSENISRDMNSILDAYFNRSCVFCKSFLIDIYPNRDAAELTSFFQKAKKEICILTTNLESLKNCVPILLKKISESVAVKICTINPVTAKEFNITRVTGGDTKPRTRFESMRNSLHYFLEKNEELFSDADTLDIDNEFHNKDNAMKIRTYSCMPTIILFIVDNECIVSFILNKHFARDVLHLHFNIDTSNMHSIIDDVSPYIFKKHFDSIYDNGDEVCDTLVSSWQYS